MFNLLVTEDKFIPYRLNIEPYVDFWSGDVIDWSNKLDRSQPIKIKPMSEINARYYNFKFKEDSDFYNDNYKKKYSESYGDRLYDSSFDFSKNTETVDVIFAPSVLYKAIGTDKVYPAIYKKSNANSAEDNMDSIIRIMQVKKIASVERPKMVGINDFNQNKPYTQADTISPNGRDPDSSGNIGTSIDIAERNKQTAKNRVPTIT